jgi:hypothetical protein
MLLMSVKAFKIIFGVLLVLLFFVSGSSMQTAPPSPAGSASSAFEAAPTQHPSPQSTEPGTRDSAFFELADATTAISAACVDSGPSLLALPAPSAAAEGDAATQLTLGQRRSLEEELGPLVVNADGTVARISNWKQMTEAERANVLRVLGKRNKQRLDALKTAASASDL